MSQPPPPTHQIVQFHGDMCKTIPHHAKHVMGDIRMGEILNRWGGPSPQIHPIILPSKTYSSVVGGMRHRGCYVVQGGSSQGSQGSHRDRPMLCVGRQPISVGAAAGTVARQAGRQEKGMACSIPTPRRLGWAAHGWVFLFGLG